MAAYASSFEFVTIHVLFVEGGTVKFEFEFNNTRLNSYLLTSNCDIKFKFLSILKFEVKMSER